MLLGTIELIRNLVKGFVADIIFKEHLNYWQLIKNFKYGL